MTVVGGGPGGRRGTAARVAEVFVVSTEKKIVPERPQFDPFGSCLTTGSSLPQGSEDVSGLSLPRETLSLTSVEFVHSRAWSVFPYENKKLFE
jgi:hypothetical protein